MDTPIRLSIVKRKDALLKKKEFLLKPKYQTENKFFAVDNLFIQTFARIFDPWVSMVYMALCYHAGPDRTCFPSIGLLSEELGIPYRKVLDVLNLLEFHNIIASTPKKKNVQTVYLLTEKSHWRLDDIYLDTSSVKHWIINGKELPNAVCMDKEKNLFAPPHTTTGILSHGGGVRVGD